jgi:hypothetical protein
MRSIMEHGVSRWSNSETHKITCNMSQGGSVQKIWPLRAVHRQRQEGLSRGLACQSLVECRNGSGSERRGETRAAIVDRLTNAMPSALNVSKARSK